MSGNEKKILAIAIAVMLSFSIIMIVSSNKDFLKISSNPDFVLISPDDGSVFSITQPTFSFTVNKQTTNPVTELVIMSSGNAWTKEWNRIGDFTYSFSTLLPNGNYTWYIILWSLSGSTYTRVGVSETRTFIINRNIPPPNQPPVADAGGTYYGKVNDAVTLDASNSYDPDGTIVKYEWDINNDGTYDTEGAKISITYPEVGNYTAKLRVTDNGGKTSVDTANIIISQDYVPQHDERDLTPFIVAIVLSIAILAIGVVYTKEVENE